MLWKTGQLQLPYLSEYRVYLNTRRITCFWGMKKKPGVIRFIRTLGAWKKTPEYLLVQLARRKSTIFYECIPLAFCHWAQLLCVYVLCQFTMASPSVLTIFRAFYETRNSCNGEFQSVNCHHVAKKLLGEDILKKIAKIERL